MTRKAGTGGAVGRKAKGSRRSPDKGESVPEHDPRWLESRWRSGLRKKLLAWFERNAREMPWRSDPTPYHVWVSEIMLQQTQVATVLPYYERWMQSFPTVADLAAADESELMRHWEGLGYYRRVRSMHAAAKKIVDEHGGEFPLDFQDVLALPGVGRYTAGAVLSISTDAKLPILEGNTQRVFSRLMALRQSPTAKPANMLLWEFAEKILPRSGSGQFNQAAMELGALICLPRAPRCDACPVGKHCAAAELGLQGEIPGKIKQIRYEDRTEFALVLAKADAKRAASRGRSNAADGEPVSALDDSAERYLARPLPEGGRWAGLWDFPRCTDASIESVESASQWLSEQLGIDVASGVRLKTLRHAVTKYRISLHVHQASMSREGTSAMGEPPAPWQWVTLEQLAALPMSVTGRKIADFLSDQRQSLLPLS